MIHIRRDFPFFNNNKAIIYFDNAATTHKPQAVIDAVSHYYSSANAPVHRGVYALAEHATDLYEQARHTVAAYIGAHDDEVVFTRGTTEGINFIATAWAERHLKPGDEIIITELEHHSNILAWIELERRLGIILKYVPITGEGYLDYQAYSNLLTSRTKLVACTHTSNVLGTRVDLPFIIKHAHGHGARVLIDAAQAAGRESLKVHELRADFLAFSGHKMCGPTGIGVLYIARHMHDQVSAYQYGGGMVKSVDMHSATWLKPPQRYEAGTPAIAQAIGLAQAVRYLEQHVPFSDLKQHEALLTAQLIAGLQMIPSIRILGPIQELKHSGHLVSFISTKMHAHDVAAYLDRYGMCVRAGNHCAQPLHKRLGIAASLRASFYAYSTQDEVTALLTRLDELK